MWKYDCTKYQHMSRFCCSLLVFRSVPSLVIATIPHLLVAVLVVLLHCSLWSWKHFSAVEKCLCSSAKPLEQRRDPQRMPCVVCWATMTSTDGLCSSGLTLWFFCPVMAGFTVFRKLDNTSLSLFFEYSPSWCFMIITSRMQFLCLKILKYHHWLNACKVIPSFIHIFLWDQFSVGRRCRLHHGHNRVTSSTRPRQTEQSVFVGLLTIMLVISAS